MYINQYVHMLLKKLYKSYIIGKKTNDLMKNITHKKFYII